MTLTGYYNFHLIISVSNPFHRLLQFGFTSLVGKIPGVNEHIASRKSKSCLSWSMAMSIGQADEAGFAIFDIHLVKLCEISYYSIDLTVNDSQSKSGVEEP